jgi:hypothetical protein
MFRRLFFPVPKAVVLIEAPPKEDPILARLAVLEEKVTSLQSAVADMVLTTINAKVDTETATVADIVPVADSGTSTVADIVPATDATAPAMLDIVPAAASTVPDTVPPAVPTESAVQDVTYISGAENSGTQHVADAPAASGSKQNNQFIRVKQGVVRI